MGTLRRLAVVWTIILVEYLTAATLLLTAVFALGTAHSADCYSLCVNDWEFGRGRYFAAALVVLIVGLPVALVAAPVQHRHTQRTGRGPSVRRSHPLSTATFAAVTGLMVAVPLSCLCAGQLIAVLL